MFHGDIFYFVFFLDCTCLLSLWLRGPMLVAGWMSAKSLHLSLKERQKHTCVHTEEQTCTHSILHCQGYKIAQQLPSRRERGGDGDRGGAREEIE